MPRNRENWRIFEPIFEPQFDGFCVKIIYKIATFWVAGQQFIGHPVYPPSGGFLVVELQPFSLRKDTKIEIFGGKIDSCPTSDNLLFGVFSSFLRVFSPVGTPRICKKVPFSGRNHTRRKDVNLKKTTIILPFFVPPDDESALRESPGSGPCP